MKIFVVAACCLSGLFAQEWNRQAAASYLDGRLFWWISWPQAQRDHETFCVSCHTALPYAMARPALRKALEEKRPGAFEQKLLDNVTRRVRMWNEVEPFYPDATRGAPKTAESRGTESILNAVVLVSHDPSSADARLALENMWAQQLKSGSEKGAWAWLQFHNSPWEGDSQYYGATLAAIAAGSSSGHAEAAQSLRDYLTRERDKQVLFHRVMLLWASSRMPNMLTSEQRKFLIDAVLSKQQADGGFSLSSLVEGWKRKDGAPQETRSDGYATAVVAYALQQTGLKRDQPQVKRALDWLAASQDQKEGRWLAYSLNKQRDLSSDVGKFMSDAATAHAVLALIGPN